MNKTTKTLIERINTCLKARGLAVVVFNSGFEIKRSGLAIGVSKGGTLKVGTSRSSASGWELDLNNTLGFGFSNTVGGLATLLEIIIK